MKKKLISFICAGVMVLGTCASGECLLANNYEDRDFSFSYFADGTDTTIKAREKKDKTATYVRMDSSSCGMFVAVGGTNNANDRNGINPNWCSDDYFVKPGKYKYISNKVYQKKYKYAYLIMGKDDKKRHEVKGKWSPDNISGRY